MYDDFLRKVSLFSGLTDQEFVDLAALTHTRDYKKGAFIVLAEDEVSRERDVVLEERSMRVDNNPSARFAEQMNAAQFLHHGEIAERNVVSVDAATHALAGDRLEVVG